MLVAATGVGAGDLATASLAGSRLGMTILWAVVLGAGMKLVLTEGLTRWQLATGTTLLEGWSRHLGRPTLLLFAIYLAAWSFFVGSALISASGVAAHALYALPGSTPETDKIVYGLVHTLAALGLVWLGGYRLFERVMAVCIAMMFLTVIATAIASRPDWSSVLSGLVVPRIPRLDTDGLEWTVALTGGVGGTVTVMCYGYWIREEGRENPADLPTCRIDLASGYVMTAVFGIGMVILSTGLITEGKGTGLLVDLSRRLSDRLGSFGPAARWAFLVGAWGAIFSSLLGVWQSVPYLFADTWSLLRGREPGRRVSTRSMPYRTWLVLLATVPVAGLWVDFARIQKLYAIVGATFLPVLAITLLILNGRRRLVGRLRNGWPVVLLLLGILVFYLLAGWLEVQKRIFG